MPIYAYRCEACGFSKDVLQKISDPQLTVCLSCGKDTFKKQVTAAGFQLKGSGWYVTDFRGGTAPATGTSPQIESASNSVSNSTSNSSSNSNSNNSSNSNSTSSTGGDSGGSSTAASSNPPPKKTDSA